MSRAAASLVAIALALAVACHPPRRTPVAPVEATSSRVDVFLRCEDPAAPAITFELSGAELRAESGELRPLEVALRLVRSSDVERRTRIAGSIVAPADYVALLLHVEGAWLERQDGRVALELAPSTPAAEGAEPAAARTFEVPLRIRLRGRDAASLFLDWRAAASLAGGLGFEPSLGVTTETPQTALGLLYVADAGAGCVLSIDRASGQVVGTFKAGAEPRALVLLRDRRRLFVANAGDGSLTVIDVRQGSVEATIPIAFSARTSDIVVAEPERWIAASNPELDSVTLVSLEPGGGLVSVPVGRTPVRLAAAPSLQRLFVVESGADSVSAIHLYSRSVVGRVAVESRPSDLDLDRDESELYVGHTTSPNLLALDAATLATRASIFVGGGMTDVLADPRRSRIYVARSRPAEVVVVERRLGAVVRRIPISGRIESMTLSRDGARLYGAAPESETLIVVDVVRGKEEAVWRPGSRPADVVVAE